MLKFKDGDEIIVEDNLELLNAMQLQLKFELILTHYKAAIDN
jgi:hypothetical protein